MSVFGKVSIKLGGIARSKPPYYMQSVDKFYFMCNGGNLAIFELKCNHTAVTDLVIHASRTLMAWIS
jgi:hypothetical protein